MITLSPKAARQILLKHQGLDNPRQIDRPDDVVRFIEKIGCVQYDPLNKVGRNADLVLQSRCKHYRAETLSTLLYEQRKLIDGWDKCMSIWSVNDWPYFARVRKEAKKKLRQHTKEFGPVQRLIRTLITKNGTINSSAVDLDQKVDWGWSPTKIGRVVLESMFHCGELMIHHKEGTRKFYHLSRTLLPDSILKATDPNPTEQDYHDWYVKRRINSIGLLWDKAGDAWLGIGNLKKEARTKAIERLLAEDQLEMVEIEGLSDRFLLSKNSLSLLNDTAEHHEASIIAPLDNLIWDRKLIHTLFHFDYKWEVYTPVNKRKYGYYVLPILYKDRFIARFEPVLDRKKRVLLIKNWWWEDQVHLDSQTIEALVRCFTAFLGFTQMNRIRSTAKKAAIKTNWLAACQREE